MGRFEVLESAAIRKNPAVLNELESAMEAPSVEAAIRLDDALHTLAQPLTAMMFVLEMAMLQSRPEQWRKALETASDECRRAIDTLDEVRAAASVCAPVPGKYEEGDLQ